MMQHVSGPCVRARWPKTQPGHCCAAPDSWAIPRPPGRSTGRLASGDHWRRLFLGLQNLTPMSRSPDWLMWAGTATRHDHIMAAKRLAMSSVRVVTRMRRRPLRAFWPMKHKCMPTSSWPRSNSIPLAEPWPGCVGPLASLALSSWRRRIWPTWPVTIF